MWLEPGEKDLKGTRKDGRKWKAELNDWWREVLGWGWKCPALCAALQPLALALPGVNHMALSQPHLSAQRMLSIKDSEAIGCCGKSPGLETKGSGFRWNLRNLGNSLHLSELSFLNGYNNTSPGYPLGLFGVYRCNNLDEISLKNYIALCEWLELLISVPFSSCQSRGLQGKQYAGGSQGPISQPLF